MFDYIIFESVILLKLYSAILCSIVFEWIIFGDMMLGYVNQIIRCWVIFDEFRCC